MAMEPRPMSTTDSIGTYDSLFDDDECTLSGICFDLDVQQVSLNNEDLCTSSPLCKGSSSCCSLCRLPAVSEAGENESNIFGLAPTIQSRPGSQARNDLVYSSRGSCIDQNKPPSNSSRACNQASCRGPCGSIFQVPIKSISIPSISISALKSDPQDQANANGIDFLSSGFLPDDALCHVAKFLDVTSLVRMRECNWKLHGAASSDSAGWKSHCSSLWSSKANVCSRALAMLSDSNKATIEDTSEPKFAAMEAYKLAKIDAATRKEVSFKELCFDAATPDNEEVSTEAQRSWSFRFKESAGRDWTSWDPWWNGEDARKLVFLRDGTIKQVCPQGLASSATNHNGTQLYDVFSERTIRRDGVDIPAPRIEMKWRFVDRPLDLPERAEGAYVRITVGGRDVPTYVVRRSPNGNWGFILESCWGVYASFELAPQVQPRSGAAGHSRRRLRRTRNGSRWVDVEESDSDDDQEVQRELMRNVRRRIDLFVEESAMTQDGYSQWREALLYNIGAVTLPEGNGGATHEFDNAWQNAMMMR